MKKLMILSAIMLLVAVCSRAVASEGMVGTCTCPDGSTGMLVSGGDCVCSRDSDIPGSCVNKKCPNGQAAMMTEHGCVCKSQDATNNGSIMRMNAYKPS